MTKKYIVAALCLLLAVSLFAGCQGQSAAAKNSDKTETVSGSASAVVGQVTAIDGNQMTLALGSLDAAERPEQPDSSQQNSNNDNPDAAATATTGQGEQQGTMPGGNAPSGQNGAPNDRNPGNGGGGFGGSSFTASGEEMTITVTDDTVITLSVHRGGPGGGQDDTGAQNSSEPQSSAGMPDNTSEKSTSSTGSLSDLVVGDIVSVTFSDSNVAETITVEPSRGGGTGFGQADGQVPDSSSPADSAATPKPDETSNASSV